MTAVIDKREVKPKLKVLQNLNVSRFRTSSAEVLLIIKKTGTIFLGSKYSSG